MAQAKSPSLRLEIVQAYQAGSSYAELSRTYSVNYNTIRTICKRYQARGSAGLQTDYARCGRRVESRHELCYRLVRLIKHRHPDWGIPLIVAKISKAYSDLPLQSIRHYQRRIRSTSSKLPKPTLPSQYADPPIYEAHDEWQVDAKERIKINDGEQEVCFLNITDTGTHGLLKVKVFPLCSDQSSSGSSNTQAHA